MRVYTKIVVNMISGQVIEEQSYEYAGPVAECKGASADQEALQKSQMSFYNLMTQQNESRFANQSYILKTLQNAWEPIVKAGPGQKGYTPAEEAAIRTNASAVNSRQYQNAAKTLRGALAARGGGNAFIPSGAENQLESEQMTQAAKQEADTQNQITQNNYNLGRQNWLKAADIMSGISEQDNPLGFAGAATDAGEAAGKTAEEVAQENAAASPWAAIGGIVGGAVDSFAGGLGKAPKRTPLATLPVSTLPNYASLAP